MNGLKKLIINESNKNWRYSLKGFDRKNNGFENGDMDFISREIRN